MTNRVCEIYLKCVYFERAHGSVEAMHGKNKNWTKYFADYIFTAFCEMHCARAIGWYIMYTSDHLYLWIQIPLDFFLVDCTLSLLISIILRQICIFKYTKQAWSQRNKYIAIGKLYYGKMAVCYREIHWFICKWKTIIAWEGILSLTVKQNSPLQLVLFFYCNFYFFS